MSTSHRVQVSTSHRGFEVLIGMMIMGQILVMVQGSAPPIMRCPSITVEATVFDQWPEYTNCPHLKLFPMERIRNERMGQNSDLEVFLLSFL